MMEMKLSTGAQLTEACKRDDARQAGCDRCVLGVPYRTLNWSEREVDDEEMASAHAACYRSSMPQRVYKKYIPIPWEPSMGVPEQIAWIGRKNEDLGI